MAPASWRILFHAVGMVSLVLLCFATLSAQTVLVGDQILESNLDSNAIGLAEAFPATATASGQVGSINFFLDETSAATKIYVGIYKDSSGKPGSLVTQGSTTQLYPGTWNSATVTAASLTSGTAYWIAILGTTGGKPYFLDRSTTSCHSQTSSQTNLTSLPSTWSTGTTWNTCYISAYAVTGTSPATVMIGDQEVESYLDKNPAGRAEAFPATANTTGNVGSIDLYLDPTSGSGPVSIGLYADNGSGHPGTLLGQGSTSHPVAGSWNQISIASSSITAGHQYWIAVLGTQTTSPYFHDRQTTVCHSETTPQTNLTALPSTWSTGTIWNTCYISAYGLPASGSATLTVSPSTLSFAATQGGSNPSPQNLSVTNTGSGTMSFTATTDESWLSVAPASGTAPQTLQVSACAGALSPGTYTGHVTITATGAKDSPTVVTVTLTVSGFAPPSITATATPVANANGWNNSTVTVTFTCTAGTYPIQTCPAAAPVTTQGANQSICGHAVDTHGNSSVTACASVSLDETPPTITATVTPAAVGGINYGSATVTFTCSDTLSGVATCPSPVTDSTIGANQKISGTATDKAGNSSSTSVTLNIQPIVLPTITATPSPAPNANGWNNSNVTVTFACTAGTYPIQTCPSPTVVNTQGANQSICGKAVDTQGNSSLQACANVSLDTTPPTITATISPAPVSGINYGSATVTFTCSDALSGVATCSPPVTDTTIGANQKITGTATDKAGNTSSTSVTLNIQPVVLPTITATPSPAPNANGWNNAPVTVSFTCTAGSYPIQTCPSPTVVSTQGANQSVCGKAVDTQGNSSAPACATVSLDTKPPTITATISPAPVSGINYGSATVTFTCSDALSGVATCPSPVTDTTIGANQNISGTATDKAGNSSSTTITLNIQATVLPTIIATPSPAPNANGWNNTPVTVSFTCTAGSYPIQSCPSPTVVNAQGANQSICGKAIDTQGNSSLQACAAVSLDTTPPTITATVSPAPVSGINYGSATVTFTCSDALSGVASCSPPVTDTTIGANQNITGTASDKAGNTSSTSVTLNIQPVVLPTITATPSPAANANGWNNTNVTVTFTCTAGSYPIQTCPSPTVVSTQGANQSICGKAIDTQGNSSVQTCANVSLDTTPPTITATLTPAPVSGINYGSATVAFTCTDALSGVATCSPPVIDTTIGANQKITGTATDKAGNTNTTSVTLNIQPTVLPTITAAAAPAPNANGWNNTTVTVSFSCAAGSYPIQTCPSPIVVTTQAANQSICGHAVDTQGNSSLQACANVSVDETPPTITAVVTPTPVSGVNYGSATVTFTCADALSGVATCSAPVTDSTIGANQNISGTATDKAGNTSSTSVTLNIQPVTLPTITATPSPAPNANGWNNTNVTVSFTCTAGSYPIQTCPSPIIVTTEAANQSICGHAVDSQGNLSASACANVSLDKTPPTITAVVSPTPVGGINYGSATVTFTCTDTLSGVDTCSSPVTDTTIGANQNVNGSATDKAGNSSSTTVTLNIQAATLPTIVATPSPLPNAAGWNNTNVTVTFACTAGTFPIKICPSPITVSTEGKNQSTCGQAVDTQGNTSSSACVNLNIDKTPPTVIPSLSPAPNAAGWETSPVTVSFTCSDSLSGIASCPSPATISADGANQPVSGTATDIAGNTTTVSANVNLEQTLPTIFASVSPLPNSAGWNNTSVTVTFTCTKSVSTITSCSSPQTVSSTGIGQIISGTVQDQAGNQATTSVTLNIDETPPTILTFTAPSQLSPGQSGTATLTVSDIAPVVSVVFQLNGTPIGTVIAPPYTINVTAPSNATSGSTLTLIATVTDAAGNVNSANKGIQVVSSGVLVGEVLSDVTSLPLQGATLQVIGQSSESATSDADGRYSIPVTNSQLFLSVSQPGNSSNPAMVTVERQVSVQSGVGTVPVDARMTAVAAPTSITSTGGTVGSGAITVTVPAGGATTSYNLTPLSQQGLPGLLPLGWSPAGAFDLQANISPSASLSASFTGLPTATLYLVSYSYNVHAWNMVTPNLTASNGSLTVPLPSTGDYALVTPDIGNSGIQIPAVGQPLTGVQMVALPTTATSSGSLSPANIAPTGGTSMASLAVQSSTPLPSGTVIQAEVTEKYTLATGQLISEEPRYEDLLLYQSPAPAGASVAATFPVTPSMTFQASQLSSGDVHMDILSGRESVRGATGGSDPVSVQSGDATLTVAAGSLAQDTAIAVTPETVDTTLPSTTTLVPLSEYNIDFSDQVLTNTAQLSVGTAGATPGTNVVIAEVQRISGVPYLVPVSLAQVTATNMVSQVTPGLPGITTGGDYVFYQVTIPTGFVSGTVSASSGPVAAMVQTDALPFVAFSNTAGAYKIVAAAGTVNLTASIPNTALAASATTQVTAGQTATQNLTVSGQVESATITPANGAVGVPLTAEIDISAADGFNTATVTSSSVILTAAGSTTPIALRFVFSSGNTKLAVFPQAALQPSTQYTLQASGIANAVGGLISVPTISFTTAAIVAPTYNTNALVFAMPDQNGNVAISAAAGSFPAGSTILIVDQTNGVVYSLTVFNDGSVTGSMPATINDILQITLTDPAGNVTNFTVSQFVAADGTTAVGPGGGTVAGPGGTGIIIPAGALTQGVTFKLTQLDQSAFPSLPSWQGANFGSGLRITDPQMPTFSKEAKLAFPVPASAPSNAFFYVYRRLTDQNGNAYFETIDEAFVQGTGANAQVVTASPPFCGYHNSYAKLTIQAGSPPLPATLEDQDYFVMWDATAQQGPSGIASQGLIVGLAQQVVPAVPGVSPATTQPAQGVVTISLDPITQGATPTQFAIYDGQCATFTLFDPQLGGGTRNVTASSTITNPPTILHASTDEVDGAQSDDGLYAIYAGLEDLYKNIGRVNFLFPSPTPPPPPPAVSIQLFTLDQNGHRVPAGGILQSGTNVVIAFQSGLTVQSASIGTTQLAIESPDSTDNEVTDGLPEQYLLGARVKGLYPLGAPGTYNISVTAIDPLSLTVVTSSQSILVVAAGGGNNSTFTCTAAAPPADPTLGCTLPQVVSVSPVNNATAVPISVFPVITFNEPVTNILPSNVILADPTGTPVPALLVGVRAPNPLNPHQNPIADPVQPSDVITSLTIEPLDGLDYNLTYSISVDAAAPNGCLDGSGNPAPQPSVAGLIVDQNQPPTGPFCLPPYPATGQTYAFTTFGPQQLGGVTPANPILTRPVIIGQMAYVGEYLSSAISGVGMFNVSNPFNPTDQHTGASFVGRAIDIAGQAQSPVTASGGGLIAVSAGTALANAIPANVWLYDVSSPLQPNRVGAVSVTSDTSAGIAIRLFMKDQYLYASTFEQGLQVIDLGQALTEFSQTTPSQFGQAVSTSGDGFAMDTIINTIPLPLAINGQATGGLATMFDLKADNFATAGGGSQVLVAETGQLPFVLIDPTLSGTQAVLYPPNSGGNFATSPVQPLLMTSTDGLTNSLLCYGQALDTGTIAFSNSNGTSSTDHIAVVVGTGITGPASSTTSCASGTSQPVLAVVNISQAYSSGSPLTPQLIGFLPLTSTATDVVLNGTVADITTGGNIMLVSLANPFQPTPAGTISGSGNFGTWLAIGTSGVIVSTSASGGLETAVSQVVIDTTCPGPILSKLISGAGTSSPVYQTVLPVTCNVNVGPSSTKVANVNVTFSQTTPALSFSNVILTGGASQVQIPAGTTITGSTLNAVTTAINLQNQTLITGSTQTPVGTVHVVVDSDNDTTIDPTKDPAAAQAGKQFSFWQADPNMVGSNGVNGGQDALLDYAPMRVYVSALPDPSVGTIQLTLSSSANNYTANWVLTHNAGVTDGSTDIAAATNEKLYLQDQNGIAAATATAGTTPLAQIALTNLPPVTCGGGSTNNTGSQLCVSSSAGSIQLSNIQIGEMYDLLFSYLNDSCLSNPENGPGTCSQDTSWTLKAVLMTNNQTPIILDQVPVDIRPLQQRMTVYSTRSGVLQPLVTPVLLPVVSPAAPWMDIPAGATKLNLLVHGFDVTQLNATQSTPYVPLIPAQGSNPAVPAQPATAGFFPTYFKRMYWTGLPVMMAQSNVQTVGLTWYGDVNEFNWPDDEFSALLTGVSLGNFLSSQTAAGRTITVVAHSLGNMVVNSALTRPEAAGALAAGAIKSYVMNEAAVPSEAFDTSSASGPSPALVSNATSDDGYSNDQTWQTQYNNFTQAQSQQWNTTLGASTYVTLPHPSYVLRWTQHRPPTGVPDSAPANSTPQRGSWLGYFAGNPGQVTITNTVNANDFVLGAIWWAGEYCEKPNIAASNSGGGAFGNCFPNLNAFTAAGCLAIFTSVNPITVESCLYGLTPGQVDSANQQYWAALTNTDAGEELTWGAYCTIPSSCKHTNITRQFSELSYWFPASSYAEGAGGLQYQFGNPSPTPVTNSVTTIDFSPYAPAYNSSVDNRGGPTHSYLVMQPYSIVSPAWTKIRNSLCPNYPTCN